MKRTLLLSLFVIAAISGFAQELIPRYCSKDKYGYIDKTGKEMIPCKYQSAHSFSEEGLAVVQFKGKWGVIDKTENEVVPFGKYDYIYGFSEGMAMVKLTGGKYGKLGKYGFIDKTGKEVTPIKYEWYTSENFFEGMAVVVINGKYGYIDKTGKEVIPLGKYDKAYDFGKEGLAKVELNRKFGFIDKMGNEIVPIGMYDSYSSASFSDKLEPISSKRSQPKYFTDGLAAVGHNYKYGFIDTTGAVVVPIKYKYSELEDKKREYFENKFSLFAKNYVESKINKWQMKGEYEKTVDWQHRVNETTRKAQTAKFLKEAEQAFIVERSKILSYGNMTLGTYDSDNEVYLINNDLYGDLLIPVSIAEAQTFRTNWNSFTKTPKYFVENDKLALAEMIFSATNGKTYKYNNQASLNYSIANIDYNFAPIDINIADNSSGQKGNQNISTINVLAGKSDVAVNIPITNIKNDKTFAVIIANEIYHDVSQVEFAVNDGVMFKEYCIKTLGLLEQNISYRANATLNHIRAEIRWIQQVAEKFNGEASIIFYYAGHGTHDEVSKSAYLLPTDGLALDVSTAYKLDDLYQMLGNLPAKTVTVFLDACYSGAGRDGKMLAQARGIVEKAKQGVPAGNMVVFTSAQGDETAYPYREKGHGLFTYFLLKKLQESKGNVTLGELSDYVTKQVGQQSVVVNRKSQTPTVIPSETLENKWMSLKLK